MKAAPFDYVRPSDLREVLAILDEAEDAKVLAGGQSLVAALNMRLSVPAILVDINAVDALKGIETRGRNVRIGALARHCEVAASQLIASRVPLVAEAMRHVAHPAIRNRGTTCGSLAYADPAAEMPACAVVLDAMLVLDSRQGRREVAARDFFHGLYETDCRSDEIIAEVLLPARREGERFGFDEVTARHGDFASVGIAARAIVAGSSWSDVDIVVFGSEPKPLLCRGLATLVAGRPWSDHVRTDLVDAVVAQMDPMANLHGSAATKRKQARALANRVLDGMAGKDRP